MRPAAPAPVRLMAVLIGHHQLSFRLTATTIAYSPVLKVAVEGSAASTVRYSRVC